ncbi:MAG: hypothetical protein K5660_06670 [Paludibacteraceae bacterium]|nr:hypothetical protein [Paludibacteraceae bacterium]
MENFYCENLDRGVIIAFTHEFVISTESNVKGCWLYRVTTKDDTVHDITLFVTDPSLLTNDKKKELENVLIQRYGDNFHAIKETTDEWKNNVKQSII